MPASKSSPDNNIGILDPEGNNLNPLNNKPYSEQYKLLAKKWSKFPVYKRINQIIQDIKESQVYLVISSTGSGKSVLIPKIVLHVLDYKGKIGMTLPKQIITKSTAEFAAITLDVELGNEVGYKYKGSPKGMYNDTNRILYATDGTIKSKLLNDPSLKEFDCIIIDEAHERSIQIDFLLYLLKETLQLRPEFKLIIMSATVNTDIFVNYFNKFKFKFIDVGGERSYPIESIYSSKTLDYKDALVEGYNILIKILESDKMTNKAEAHDIIFFVVSANDAFDLCRKLNAYLKKETGTKSGLNPTKCNITCSGDVYCAELYAGIDPTKQDMIVDKELYKLNTKYNRKVVITTNVAESSLTVDGIKYVIDTGYQLKNSFDVKHRARQLEREYTSQSQVTQRMGRSGRTEPGICYHLYTQADFDRMKKYPETDIRTNDITMECLNLLAQPPVISTSNLVKILNNLIEPPKDEYVKYAIENLTLYKLLSNNQINPLGYFLNQMPTNNINMGIALLYGKIYNCSHEVIKIISTIDVCKNNISELYNMPMTMIDRNLDESKQKQQQAQLEKKFNDARKLFYSKYGDHIGILNIYEKFDDFNEKIKHDDKKLYEWTFKYFLKKHQLLKIKKHIGTFKRQLYGSFKDKLEPEALGIQVNDEINKLDVNERIIYCFAMGFKQNIATRIQQTDTYRTPHVQGVKINKISFCTVRHKFPKNIVYTELFTMMGKSELSIVSHLPKNIIALINE